MAAPRSPVSAYFDSSEQPSPYSIAVHPRADEAEVGVRPLVPGITQSTTFRQQRVGENVPHTYSRCSNPSVNQLERQLGDLEGTPPAVTFATGLAAESALFLALLEQGDHAVVGEAIYGGTVRLFQQVLNRLGITCTFVDTTDVAQIAGAIRPNTKLVFVETPANPTLVLTDIAAVAKITRPLGIKLIVDNTFLTPVIQRPLELGADICVYSTTKHIDGHSLALGGAITSHDEKLIERVRFIRKSTGAIQSPFGAWATSNGIKTLPLRIERHSKNALEVAQWLQSHPNVTRVHYPGLADFPQAKLARAQHTGLGGDLHGGVIAFEVSGGTPAGIRTMNSVKFCALVEHVGSVETLITHPASMTHGDVPREHRLRVGIPDGLIRLSVGIEDPADIIADLDQAICAAHSVEVEVEAGGALCATVA